MMLTTIVSGLPRSGTSTMMRMIHYGGMEVVPEELTKVQEDHAADGTYELDNVGSTLKESTPEFTAGKVVKLVAPYMMFLPTDRPIQVIYMLRDLREIVASLLAMDAVWSDTPEDILRFSIQTLEDRNIPVLYIQYKEMVKYPKTCASMVVDFLNMDLDIEGMVKAVDKRVRAKTGKEIVTYAGRHGTRVTLKGTGEKDTPVFVFDDNAPMPGKESKDVKP